MQIQSFTFNPFEENTYILFDSTNECIIVDPGCFDKNEKQKLVDFIELKKLKPVKILLTHAHIDHILGNNFVAGKYKIPIQMSIIETGMLMAASEYGRMWGIESEPSPAPELFVEEGADISFGSTKLKPIFTPGHSPGSFSYYHEPTQTLIAGDVLFMESIGRTDLPGGDYNTLISSIRNKLFPLPDNVKVFPGHGPDTSIGYEKQNNPFLNG